MEDGNEPPKTPTSPSLRSPVDAVNQFALGGGEGGGLRLFGAGDDEDNENPPVVRRGGAGGSAGSPPVRRGGLFGAASPAVAAAAAATSPVRRFRSNFIEALSTNRGENVDDDNSIEIYGKKVAACEGKFYAIKDFALISHDHPELAQQLIQTHRTFEAAAFRDGTAADGIYTFLVVIDEPIQGIASRTYSLLAKRVVSMLEIGTRHHCIACDESLRVKKILCGGELVKTPTGLRFNLQSGHYTLTRFKKTGLGALVDENVAPKSKRYTAAVLALLPGAVHVPVEGDTTFITEAAIGDTPIQELQLYAECGLSVFQFDDRKRALMFQEEVKYEAGKPGNEHVLEEALGLYNGVPFEREVTAAAVGTAAAPAAAAAAAFASPSRKSRKRRSSSRSSRSSRSRSSRKTRRSSRNIRR